MLLRASWVAMLLHQGGVLFKGNLRGKAANSYEKITKRMQVCVWMLLHVYKDL